MEKQDLLELFSEVSILFSVQTFTAIGSAKISVVFIVCFL